MRQTTMNASRGDMTMLGNPALAVQLAREDIEVLLDVDSRIMLIIMLSDDRSMEY